jgi:hypothetical protein
VHGSDQARGRWCTAADRRELHLTDPSDRSAIEAWSDAKVPEFVQPWQREGWFATARAWIAEVVPEVSDVQQFATWCNSCVLRVTSANGRLWFKAVPA